MSLTEDADTAGNLQFWPTSTSGPPNLVGHAHSFAISIAALASRELGRVGAVHCPDNANATPNITISNGVVIAMNPLDKELVRSRPEIKTCAGVTIKLAPDVAILPFAPNRCLCLVVLRHANRITGRSGRPIHMPGQYFWIMSPDRDSRFKCFTASRPLLSFATDSTGRRA